MSIDEYCSSEDYSLEGLQELFPDYYNRCQEAYAQDKALIAEINRNLEGLLEEGRNEALTDVKASEVATYSSALGTYGDILVSLNIDSGSSGFAGHAAIVSSQTSYTIESYTSALTPEEGTERAHDVLRLTLCEMKERGISPPSPSDVHALSVGPNDSLALICCEMIE